MRPWRAAPASTCVSNFYQIRFNSTDDQFLQLRIFHCYYHLPGEPEARICAREDTELKRRIFEAPRREGGTRAQQQIENALGVQRLTFGGDCAAGIRTGEMFNEHPAPLECASRDLVVNDEDRYEVLVDSIPKPAVVRERLPDGTVRVELYEPGTFYFENRERTGPFKVPALDVQPRRFERQVHRGEDLCVPAGRTLRLWPGQALVIEPCGPEREDRAGRLLLARGAGVHCCGGTVDNEGILSVVIDVDSRDAPTKAYRVEFHARRQLLLRCLADVPQLDPEERAAALQCFVWVLERGLRNQNYLTLGGRGYYRMWRPEPLQVTRSFHRGAERQLPPLAYLYRGCVATPVNVRCGPCLKVDFSTRIVQSQSVLDRIVAYREDFRRRGQAPPTDRDFDELLQAKLRGRTCMTTHRECQYRIERVCFEKSPLDTFPHAGGEISYYEYFLQQYNQKVDKQQPLLHIPRRRNEERYLPASLGYLTGLDEEHHANPDLMQGLMKALHQKPERHWEEQGTLVQCLDTEACSPAGALHPWGMRVELRPREVPCTELRHDPVFFDPAAAASFHQGSPGRHAVATERPNGEVGFAQRPWPHVWTDQGGLQLRHWLVFHGAEQEQRDLAKDLVGRLQPLVVELQRVAGQRLVICPPKLVAVDTRRGGSKEWLEFFERHEWDGAQFALVVLPTSLSKRDGTAYFSLKSLLTFSTLWGGVPTQMVKEETLRRSTQGPQILRNIIQQVLIKRGAWLWVTMPFPDLVMAVGIDAIKQGDSPAIQTLCASMNPYFTQYHVAWRVRKEVSRRGVFSWPPGDLLDEALDRFHALNRCLPRRLVVYRNGVSESFEGALMEAEIKDSEAGVLATVDAVRRRFGWEQPVEVAYILARRGTNARFRTANHENVRSGTVVSDEVVSQREHFEFYMVSQSFVVATARPTLYTLMSSTLQLEEQDVKQMTYKLCGLYQTFAGMVALPAPLKYATKLLLLLARCDSAHLPRDSSSQDWNPGSWQRSCLFFV